MRSIVVRTVNASGSPSSGNRVAVYVYQFAAGGMTDAVYTDSRGEAHISLNVDQGAEIAIYVNGAERVGRGSIRSEYSITV